MRGFLAAALALGLAVGSAWAGDGPTDDGSKPPAKLETVYAYFEASGKLDNLQPAKAREQVMALFLSKHPGLGADKLKAVQPIIDELIDQVVPGLVAARAKIIAEHLSDDDLQAMIAFYHSDAGKRWVAAQPVITRETLLVNSAIMQKATERLKIEILQKKKAEAQKS